MHPQGEANYLGIPWEKRIVKPKAAQYAAHSLQIRPLSTPDCVP